VRAEVRLTDIVEIYTDGACKGNPGPGGWGVLLRYKDQEKRLWGGEPLTTNNRMELIAVIKALQALKRPSRVRLTTDSQYVCKGITSWIQSWRQRGWRTSARTEVKNLDLWQALDQARQAHDIEWVWVRGHEGHPENELADQLANLGVTEQGRSSRG